MGKVSFWEVFPNGNVFLVAVHAESEAQVLRNAGIAYSAGADGIFLISHGAISSSVLLHLYQSVKQVYPIWWVGLNFLDLSTLNALLTVPSGVSGLWTDDAGIDESVRDSSQRARLVWKQRELKTAWRGLYFGGVAFKYQQQVYDAARVAELAAPYMDVITTSGDATGSPPTVEKVWAMRRAIGEHPLAIASGITPENVRHFLGVADCFIVATGISKSFIELDLLRVRELARIIHSS